MDSIELEREGGITTVRINRSKVLNALNQAVLSQLEDAFRQMAADRETRAVIVTGAGEKAFVAGADIKELANLDTVSGRKTAAFGQTVFRAIERFQKPVIAAINGFALGGGCELALACHLRIASKNARLGLPEVTLGLIPGYGGTQRLARLIGKGLALEMILTGEMISAERAAAVGLVNHVVTPEELMPKARAIATKIIKNGPVAVHHALDAVNHGLDMSLEDGERLEASLFGMLASTWDTKEGLTAFLEKRPPEFRGE
jgi:enoyl-CoA hydratase